MLFHLPYYQYGYHMNIYNLLIVIVVIWHLERLACRLFSKKKRIYIIGSCKSGLIDILRKNA